MSVLVDSEIRRLVSSKGLIDPFDDASLQGASYDMRLGRRYVRDGELRLLTEESPTLVVRPGDFVLLSTLEQLRMPLNLVGHNGIMSPWAKRGLVSLFSPQIDPGFVGLLTVPVFNAGDTPVSLLMGERVFTVEFERTARSALRGWSDVHGPQLTIGPLSGPTTNRPSLADVTALKATVQELQFALGTEKVRWLTEQSETRVRLAEALTEFKVLEAKLERRDYNRTIRFVLAGLAIAVVTAILTLLATPWFQQILHQGH